MKTSLCWLLNLLIGMAVGICLSLVCCNRIRQDAPDAQKDTVIVEKKVYYSKLELESNTYRLDVPEIGVKEYVIFQVDSIIYKDKLVYAAAQREYYHTRTDKAEIWHSGIESRIDSLIVTSTNTIVTEVKTTKPDRHSFTIYGEMGYMQGISMKAGAKYLYHPSKWIGLGGSVERDFISKQTGFYGNLDLTFEW